MDAGSEILTAVSVKVAVLWVVVPCKLVELDLFPFASQLGMKDWFIVVAEIDDLIKENGRTFLLTIPM